MLVDAKKCLFYYFEGHVFNELPLLAPVRIGLIICKSNILNMGFLGLNNGDSDLISVLNIIFILFEHVCLYLSLDSSLP